MVNEISLVGFCLGFWVFHDKHGFYVYDFFFALFMVIFPLGKYIISLINPNKKKK